MFPSIIEREASKSPAIIVSLYNSVFSSINVDFLYLYV